MVLPIQRSFKSVGITQSVHLTILALSRTSVASIGSRAAQSAQSAYPLFLHKNKKKSSGF